MCMLCKKKYEKKVVEKIVIYPCGTIFHLECAEETFSQKKNLSCPLCRKKIHMVKGLAMAVDLNFSSGKGMLFPPMASGLKKEKAVNFFQI